MDLIKRVRQVNDTRVFEGVAIFARNIQPMFIKELSQGLLEIKGLRAVFIDNAYFDEKIRTLTEEKHAN